MESRLKSFGGWEAGAGVLLRSLSGGITELCPVKGFWDSIGAKGSFVESPSWQIVAPPFQPNPRDGTKAMAQEQTENLCSSTTPFENHFSTSAICNTRKLITFCTYWLTVQML